mmetsp:Transcript_20125/g.41723  ORF Transcript_20125/g.41723 Transcript_20125/m.41723 type:complete len:234 (-) Transcript_20125:134-835(-)
MKGKVVEMLSGGHPCLRNVCLDDDLIDVVQKGRVFSQYVPGQSKLAALAIHLDDVDFFQAQPISQLGHGRAPPLFLSPLVVEAFLVIDEHRCTNVVEGDERVQLGGMVDGRVARKSTTLPDFGEFLVETRIVIDPKTEKCAAVRWFWTAQGMTRSELHHLAISVLDFLPYSGFGFGEFSVLCEVRAYFFDCLVLFDGIHFFPQFPMGVERVLEWLERQHVGLTSCLSKGRRSL